MCPAIINNTCRTQSYRRHRDSAQLQMLDAAPKGAVLVPVLCFRANAQHGPHKSSSLQIASFSKGPTGLRQVVH